MSTWLLSSGQDFGKKFLDSKHVLKVYFKPSRKKSGLLISTTSVQACLHEKWPLKSKSMSPTLTPTEFSTLTYYHQFAHRLEIHLYSDKTVDTWDSNRHEFAKTWHFKHTDPEKNSISHVSHWKKYILLHSTVQWGGF